MGWLKNVLVGLKVARAIEQQAGAMGVTIKGRNPAEVDAAVDSAVRTIVQALKKKPVAVIPPSSPGD